MLILVKWLYRVVIKGQIFQRLAIFGTPHPDPHYFPNSLAEKTTNDIPINFSKCHFQEYFYRLSLSNRRINLQIFHVRRKAVFMF